MSLNKTISIAFVVLCVTMMAPAQACKLNIMTLCETVKTDVPAAPNFDEKCTCNATEEACNILDKGAPYNFEEICKDLGKKLLGLDLTNCECTSYPATCKKVDECNNAHHNNSSSLAAMMMSSTTSTTEMMVEATMVESTSTMMMNMTSSSSEVMMETATVSATESMSTTMMTASKGNSTGNAAIQSQVARSAILFSTLLSVICYYLL